MLGRRRAESVHRVGTHAAGNHRTGRRSGLRWLAVAAGLAVSAVTVLAMQPADASPVTVKAQLSLSGVVTKTSPLGGSVVGIHPGDSITFSASSTPTAGLEALGLGSLTDGLNLTGITMVADFSHLPGATKLNSLTTKASAYPLSGTRSATFAFPSAGTYSFTWSAKSLFGVIQLDGNQLAAAGIKLNASNQYVGKVVVSDNPPTGGISIQLPGVSAAPSVPVVGQLPTVGVPNVNPPTVAVPSGVPGLPGASKSKTKPAPSTGINYTPPGLTVPEKVVPKGDGAVAGPDLNADPNLTSGFGAALPGFVSSGSGASHSKASSDAPAPAAVPAGHPVSEKPVEIASAPQSASGQMPVILAIAAIIALSLVTATYARLYLLRKNG